MARLLLLTIVLIAYGSLYPWRFRAVPLAANPLSIVLHSWPRRLDPQSMKDIAVNIVVYMPLGLLAFSTFARPWKPRIAILASLLLACLLSLSIELSQVFIESRVPSLLDIATNTAGGAIGIVAGIVWARRRRRLPQRPDSDLLLGFWVLAQCFPFYPHLKSAITLRSSPADILLDFAEPLALVPIVRSLHATERHTRFILGALLLLVPLKAFIDSREAALAAIVCSAVVFAIAWFLPIRAAFAASLLAFAIIVQGLSPFHFAPAPRAFLWIPFQASFYSQWLPALTVMLGKAFSYGALVWLLREAGAKLYVAAAGTAVLLAALETMQMYLPGRSSEIVDPLLALTFSWVFSSLARENPAGEALSCCMERNRGKQ